MNQFEKQNENNLRYVDAPIWIECYHEESGLCYYADIVRGQTTWYNPFDGKLHGFMQQPTHMMDSSTMYNDSVAKTNSRSPSPTVFTVPNSFPSVSTIKQRAFTYKNNTTYQIPLNYDHHYPYKQKRKKKYIKKKKFVIDKANDTKIDDYTQLNLHSRNNEKCIAPNKEIEKEDSSHLNGNDKGSHTCTSIPTNRTRPRSLPPLNRPKITHTFGRIDKLYNNDSNIFEKEKEITQLSAHMKKSLIISSTSCTTKDSGNNKINNGDSSSLARKNKGKSAKIDKFKTSTDQTEDVYTYKIRNEPNKKYFPTKDSRVVCMY